MKFWVRCCAAMLSFTLLPLVGCASNPAPVAPDTPSASTAVDVPTPQPPSPSPSVAVSPTRGPEERAEALLRAMSVEEKVGQMFFIRCPAANVTETVKEFAPGGLLLFARDFEGKTPSGLQEEIQNYQAVTKTPLFIGVDEEGGKVTRISRYPAFRETPFASPQTLYNEGGLPRVREDTEEKADLLLDLGINVNFAPVCDVAQTKGSFMYPRAFGQGAAETADYVETVVSVMREARLGAVLKHFPGYGENGDTHTDIVTDTRPLLDFKDTDFLPFQAGIVAGAGAVLVSHNVVTIMDAEFPASLSKRVHEILRADLGFEGVVITDDLVMSAITKAYGVERAAVLAVLAGNDMLCATDYERQIPAVVAAVEEGEIPEAMLDSAVLRVLLWKMELGLLE